MISPCDFSTRAERKEWIFDTVTPTYVTHQRYVIRRIKTGYYYATGPAGELIWAFPIANCAIDHFHSPAIARRQFPWWAWIGNWIDRGFPKFLRKRIPYRLYEIISVDIVYEECHLNFPEFNDTVLTACTRH